MRIQEMISCCKATARHRRCKRTRDGKVFRLPRRFTLKRCRKGVRGFTMRSSCAPYAGCMQKGGARSAMRAVCVIDMNGITGTVHFSQRTAHARVKVEYRINGLTSGQHGFHIHQYGDMTEGCKSACAHFNPNGCVHGGPRSAPDKRHAGDLGNITSRRGLAKGALTVPGISLDPRSRLSIIGRCVVLHKDRDDLGKGGDAESLKTGNAGARVACAVIGLAKRC